MQGRNRLVKSRINHRWSIGIAGTDVVHRDYMICCPQSIETELLCSFCDPQHGVGRTVVPVIAK